MLPHPLYIYIYTHTHTYIHKCKVIFMWANTHTHTHTHIYIYNNFVFRNSWEFFKELFTYNLIYFCHFKFAKCPIETEKNYFLHWVKKMFFNLLLQGDGNIRYYELVGEAPYCHYLNQYQSSSPQRSLGKYFLSIYLYFFSNPW